MYYKDSNNILRISLVKNKKSTNNLNNFFTKNKKDEEDIEMKDEISYNKNMNKDEKENVNIKNIYNNNIYTDNNIEDYNIKGRLITENKQNINFIKIKNTFNIEIINDKKQLKEEDNIIKEANINIKNVKEYIDDIFQNLIEEEKYQILYI